MKEKIVFKYLVLLVLVSVDQAFSFQLIRGRPVGKHGLLGLPKTSESYVGDSLPKAQWFEQRLDHFDPVNTQTWKQVFTQTVLLVFDFIILYSSL